MFHKKVDSIQTRPRNTSENLSEQTIETIEPYHLSKPNNQYSKTHGRRLRERMTTVFCCVCIIVFGITFLTQATPVTTTIGENISTNDLSVGGTITSGSWAGTAIDIAHGGTGQDWSTATQGSFPYFSDTGILSALSAGTAGQFLQSGGAGADPSWSNVTRSATFVIAASDSSTLSKQQADYVCDGTDDQVEIQAAIDALPASGGKILLLSGNYAFSAHIISNVDNVIISGEGMYNTKIQSTQAYTGTGIAFNIYGTIGAPLNSWTISNLSIDLSGIILDGSTSDRISILFNYVENVTIEYVKIENSPCTAIGVANGAKHVTLSDNYLDRTGQGLEFGYGLQIQKSSIDSDVVENIIINNNYINENGWNSIAIYGNSEKATITNNVINSMALSHSGIAASSGKYLTISDNVISNTILAGEAGIEVEATTAHASNPHISSYITINGNILYNNRVGIDIRKASGETNQYVAVNGNIVNDSLENGIRILQSYGVVVSGNVITNTLKEGISCYLSNHVLISNNSVEESGSHGIYIYSSSNNIVSGNSVAYASRSVTNISNTIDVRGASTYNLITNNKVIAAESGNIAARAIAIAVVTCERNIVTDNDIRGTYGTETLVNWGSNTVIKYNHGYITETSGAKTLFNTTSTVVTHGLAVTPTRVQLTPTSDTAGKRYWISNKTATTFTINLDSSLPSDISFDWRAVVGEGN